MIAEIVPEEMEEMDYLKYKTEILFQIGLTDRDMVESYLEEKCANATSETNKRIKIDNAARKLMDDFYDGDRTYVKGVDHAVHCHKILKRSYPKMETLYEDVIIRTVGRAGLDALKKANLIETCGGFNGRKLYAI